MNRDDRCQTAQIERGAEALSQFDGIVWEVDPATFACRWISSQAEAILGLGRWLAANGEAIYNTRPWRRAFDRTLDGAHICYTQSNGYLYLILLQLPAQGRLVLRDMPLRPGSSLQMLFSGQELSWQLLGDEIHIDLPAGLDPQTIAVLRAQLAE